MIKPNKRKSTKTYSNLISKIRPLISKDHRGITLIALIITIIVMLILVAVSVIVAIKGDLFGITKRAAKRTEKEKNAEQVLANGRIKIDNTWYDSLEDYLGGKPSGDQNESNIKFIYEPKGWTKGPVKVKIESKEDKGQLQYRMDGATWTNYTEEIEVENNGTKIYAREVNDIEEEVEIEIDKIDKEAPTITAELASTNETKSSINLEIGVTDSLSGISKIEWYYKKSTDPESEYAKNKTTNEYKTMNGKEAGEKTAVTKTRELSKLEEGTTYNIYVVVYDVAGNPVRVPETGTTDVQTIDSLLGKSATIDGEKYIVLYEPGEKIQIGDEEYEIENPQLISAITRQPELVHLGNNDGQINWYMSNIKAEADIDESGSLDNIEKAIYSYNHMIETLNNKCKSLVDTSNPDILSVRSVGSNPIDPSSENSTLYTSWFSETYPSNKKGFYNGKLKSTDENYLNDRNRITLLGIFYSENNKSYWLASRFVNNKGSTLAFEPRYCLQTNYSASPTLFEVRTSSDYSTDWAYRCTPSGNTKI